MSGSQQREEQKREFIFLPKDEVGSDWGKVTAYDIASLFLDYEKPPSRVVAHPAGEGAWMLECCWGEALVA